MGLFSKIASAAGNISNKLASYIGKDGSAAHEATEFGNRIVKATDDLAEGLANSAPAKFIRDKANQAQKEVVQPLNDKATKFGDELAEGLANSAPGKFIRRTTDQVRETVQETVQKRVVQPFNDLDKKATEFGTKVQSLSKGNPIVKEATAIMDKVAHSIQGISDAVADPSKVAKTAVDKFQQQQQQQGQGGRER